MKVIQNNDGMVGQQFLQGCSRLMKESQKNAGSFCCVFGSKINYSLTIHTDLTRLRIMIPHVWIAYKLHQFYRFQIPWNQKKKTSTLTHLPKNHKSFTCFSGVFPPPEAWTNDDTRHLRHRDVWWGGFFSTEVPFFFTSQNKVWQSKSLKARKVSWRKLPFTISKHILYIYIYTVHCTYIWSILPPSLGEVCFQNSQQSLQLWQLQAWKRRCWVSRAFCCKSCARRCSSKVGKRTSSRVQNHSLVDQIAVCAFFVVHPSSNYIQPPIWHCCFHHVSSSVPFEDAKHWLHFVSIFNSTGFGPFDPICPPRRGQDVAASYAENVGCTLNSSTIKIDCPRSIWCCGKTLHLSSVSRNFMTSFHASSLFDYLWFRTFPLLSFTLCRLGELAKSYLSSHTHTCHGQKWL